MAYYGALDTAYRQYLSLCASKSSRYDSHKSSELKSICCSILAINKDAPLYLTDPSPRSGCFAVALKEQTRELHNIIASLGGIEESGLLNKKTAYSSNPSLVSADFIGTAPPDGELPPMEIAVSALASGQTNTGHFLPASSPVPLVKGSYSFDITINDLNYEFQYSIKQEDTNLSLQKRLARLISKADIGVKADVMEDGAGNSALRLSSAASGLKSNCDMQFYIFDDHRETHGGSVDYLGMASISIPASNAEFLLNGEPHSSSVNDIALSNLFELHLKNVSSAPDDVALIGLKADVDSLAENIGSLITGYNSFLEAAEDHRASYPKSGRLIREMTHIARQHLTRFQEAGISLESNGLLSLDEAVLRSNALLDGGKEILAGLKEFTASLLQKTREISLNPMAYVEKTIVAYKNPGRNFPVPYITSAYSGMIFNAFL